MKRLPVELKMTINNYWVVVGVKDKNVKKLFIPDKVDGYEVRSIADRAFANNATITYVNLPSTVDYIGEGAFRNCSSLEQVYRYHSARRLEINSRAFMDCQNLVSVFFNDIYKLGSEAFKNCVRLEEFQFTECGKLINFLKGTFENTNIKHVTLYNQQICKNAFAGTPVEEVYIVGKPRFSDEFLEVIREAKVYVKKNSPMLDLAFLGLHVEEFV